ncbi:MAG: AAA family ATPase [Clostridiales bacterium]|nr:AAA family ATPase [Clostridiales bacterium]
MELQNIITKSSDFLKLQEEMQKGSLAKSILLVTQDGNYSYEFALSLASVIFNNGDFIKNENYLKVENLSHPDLKIYPQKEKLMVADSDSIVEEASIKPIFADKKVIIIRNIDNAMEQAQNKLLKTLEEPANNVYFILTTTLIEQVLPTIRSRCNKTVLEKLPVEVARQLCEGNELAVSLCDGYAGKALRLSQKENLKFMFDDVLSCITGLKNSKNLILYSKKLSSYKDEFNLLIEMFSLIFEDMLFIKTGKINKVKLKGYIQQLQMIESEFTISAINEIRKLFAKAVKEMMYNCNFIIVIENLLLNILEVKYICR